MLNIAVAHAEKYPVFPHRFCPPELKYYNNLLFQPHRPNWMSYAWTSKLRSNSTEVNSLMHTSVCWHTALLEDVSVTVMAQVDEASLAPAFSSTSW